MKTKNFQIHIQIRNVPSDSEEQIELELFDVLNAIRQLPYDFDCAFKRDGSWL